MSDSLPTIEALIAQAIEEESAQRAAQEQAALAEIEAGKAAAIEAIKQHIESALDPALLARLNIGYYAIKDKSKKSKGVGRFHLTDETGKTWAARIEAAGAFLYLEIPNLDQRPEVREHYPWISFHDSNDKPLSRVLLLVIAAWNEKVEQLKVEMQQRNLRRMEVEAKRNQANLQKQEQQRQRQQQLEAWSTIAFEQNEQIETLLEIELEKICWTVTLDQPLTLYFWEWRSGGYSDDDGEHFTGASAYALTDTVDAEGYVQFINPDRQLKISPIANPIIEKITISSVKDAIDRFGAECPPVWVRGIRWQRLGNEQIYVWSQEGAVSVEFHRLPVRWVRSALGWPQPISELRLTPPADCLPLPPYPGTENSEDVPF